MFDNSIFPISAGTTDKNTSPIEDIFVGDVTNSANFRKTLFDLINIVSPKKYSVSTADLVDPLRAPDNSQKNTVIMLVEQPDLGLFNPKHVWYNRIHTNRLGTLTLSKGTAFTVKDLLIQINASLNTTIKADELSDFVLPTPDINGNVTFSLLFNDSSFRYYSGPEVIIKSILNNAPVSKESLGLGNVDDTSDKDKPMSTAQLLAAASERVIIENYVDQYVSTEIQKVVLQSGTNGTSNPVWSVMEW